jgi:hypothetical protein
MDRFGEMCCETAGQQHHFQKHVSLREKRVVEETGGHRGDREPYRGRRAVEGLKGHREGVKDCRGVEGCRASRGP